MKKIVLLILIICFDFTVTKSNNPPIISGIDPSSVSSGDIIKITGKYFEDTQNSSYVTIYGTNVLVYISWSNTEIKVKVPFLSTITNCSVTVTVNGIKSNEFDIIRNFEWMKKNLDVDHYRNGDSIPQVTDPTEWENLTTGAWCYYNNDTSLGKIYGKLYNWYAVNDPRGLAPEGLNIPIDCGWSLYDVCNEIGGYMKETGTSHWHSPNEGATNFSGFTAIPGGFRYYNGIFGNIGYEGNWWSIVEGDKKNAWASTIYSVSSTLDKGSHNKRFGFSVRCLRFK
jgi:uncharacterized protein (TIGR02145 family)